MRPSRNHPDYGRHCFHSFPTDLESFRNCFDDLTLMFWLV
ncbi:hypothetical protein M3J09_001572 [Ascochyta lentis]